MTFGQKRKRGSCRHSLFLFDALLIDPMDLLAKLTELEDSGGFKDGSKIHDIFTAYSDAPLWGNWSQSWLAQNDFTDQSAWPSLTVAQVFLRRPNQNALSLPYDLGILFRNRGAVNAATLPLSRAGPTIFSGGPPEADRSRLRSLPLRPRPGY